MALNHWCDTQPDLAPFRLAQGQIDAARMELDAARQVFERLAAGPDLARIEALTGLTRSKAGCG